MKPALFLWRGCALVIGTRIASLPHSHYAAQISYGIHGPFCARLQPDAPWESTRAAIFAPNQPHEIEGGETLLAHLFLEVKSCPAALHAGFHEAAAFVQVEQAIRQSLNCPDTPLPLARAEQAVTAWRSCIPALASMPPAGTAAPKGAQRVAKALAHIEQHPQTEPDGAQLAQLVHLSASRFTHLFRAETGLTLSRYLLWTRLLNAIDAVAQGQNMTQAAHTAGFADSAHMSRSFRGVFGITPSELLKMTIAFKRG